MGFIDENLSALELGDLAKQDVICYFSLSKGVVVNGYKKLFELSSTKIILTLNKLNKLEILGENLAVKEISASEIVLVGQVKTINVV